MAQRRRHVSWALFLHVIQVIAHVVSIVIGYYHYPVVQRMLNTRGRIHHQSPAFHNIFVIKYLVILIQHV